MIRWIYLTLAIFLWSIALFLGCAGENPWVVVIDSFVGVFYAWMFFKSRAGSAQCHRTL